MLAKGQAIVSSAGSLCIGFYCRQSKPVIPIIVLLTTYSMCACVCLSLTVGIGLLEGVPRVDETGGTVMFVLQLHVDARRLAERTSRG